MRLGQFAVVLLIQCLAAASAWGQQPPFPDAAASDPRTLGWMQGSPPPPDKVIRFADGSMYRFPLQGWSYRNMWWVTHNEHGAFAARGIHGQAIYIDPKAEMVIARFASHPLASNVNLDPVTLPAFHALARHLIARPR